MSLVRRQATQGGPMTVGKTKAAIDDASERHVRKILERAGSAATFTVRDLALELHLSPSYLQRLFKHQTGVSIGEWLIEQRLQRAAHLLAHSYMSVKEIAYSVGYEHPSSFVRAFGRRFAQAPTCYRRRCDVAKC
jgi:AraC-like DNA-binding protein